MTILRCKTQIVVGIRMLFLSIVLHDCLKMLLLDYIVVTETAECISTAMWFFDEGAKRWIFLLLAVFGRAIEGYLILVRPTVSHLITFT